MGWVECLSNEQADGVFGSDSEQIVSATKLAIRRVIPSSNAHYGQNGNAVFLFLGIWRQVPWRRNEGAPSPRDSEVIRVTTYEEALNPTLSKEWSRSLIAAGYQSVDPILSKVWSDAFVVGNDVGGHHAAFLAAASAGELAQPQRDLHFFLSMMPWIRNGYWPCGWDDKAAKLKVL